MAIDAIGEAYSTSKEPVASVSVPHGSLVKSRKWWQLGGRDYSHVAVDSGYETHSEVSLVSDGDSELVKNRNNVYEDKEAAAIYKPIEGYEGAHRFIPDATWTKEEEAALLSRVRIIGLWSRRELTVLSAQLEDCTSCLSHVLRTTTRPR